MYGLLERAGKGGKERRKEGKVGREFSKGVMGVQYSEGGISDWSTRRYEEWTFAFADYNRREQRRKTNRNKDEF